MRRPEFPLLLTCCALLLAACSKSPAIKPPRIKGVEEVAEVRRHGIAYDRDEHTSGISAAGIAGRVSGGQIVAISVPAPTDRFQANEQAIVEALKASSARLT